MATGVSELLVELGGKPLATPALEETAHALIDDSRRRRACSSPSNEDEIVGVLGVSWQIAIRIPGRYGLIQELWVKPQVRGT